MATSSPLEGILPLAKIETLSLCMACPRGPPEAVYVLMDGDAECAPSCSQMILRKEKEKFSQDTVSVNKAVEVVLHFERCIIVS